MAVSVKQGESLDFPVYLKDRTTLVDYTCRIQVRDSSDVLAGVDRAITTYNSTSTQFEVRLTTAETGAMALGDYTLSAQLDNTETGQSVEINDTLTITKQYNY